MIRPMQADAGRRKPRRADDTRSLGSRSRYGRMHCMDSLAACAEVGDAGGLYAQAGTSHLDYLIYPRKSGQQSGYR